MPEPSTGEIVIRGITLAGKTFRPSDWAERLAGLFSSMGPDNRMCYSPYVQPVNRAGLRCVVINRELVEADPQVYLFLVSFARDNELLVVEGRQAPRG